MGRDHRELSAKRRHRADPGSTATISKCRNNHQPRQAELERFPIATVTLSDPGSKGSYSINPGPDGISFFDAGSLWAAGRNNVSRIESHKIRMELHKVVGPCAHISHKVPRP